MLLLSDIKKVVFILNENKLNQIVLLHVEFSLNY